jgi:hypothetical protein
MPETPQSQLIVSNHHRSNAVFPTKSPLNLFYSSKRKTHLGKEAKLNAFFFFSGRLEAPPDSASCEYYCTIYGKMPDSVSQQAI